MQISEWRFVHFYFLAMQSRLVWAVGGEDTNYKVKYSFGRRDHVWTFADEKTRHTLTVNLLFAGGLYVEGQHGCGGSDPGIGLARARYPSTSDIVILDAGTWELSVWMKSTEVVRTYCNAICGRSADSQ